MMHGTIKLKFIEAKQANEYTNIRKPKENCTKLIQPYGITRYVDRED